MTKSPVLNEKDSLHLPYVVLIRGKYVTKQIKPNRVFRHSTDDRIKYTNNVLKKLRKMQEKFIKTKTVQPSWWSESIHQAWLDKNTK